MNKPDAAEQLGLSMRQLERMVTGRRIRSYKIKTANGQQADFKEEDVERLRQELAAERGEDLSEEAEVVPLPEVAITPLATARRIEVEALPQKTTALATYRQGETVMVPATSRQESSPEPAKVFASFHRVVLNIEDICIQTHFSPGFVRAAFQSGELKGKKIGRGWCANREDFDAWRKKLME